MLPPHPDVRRHGWIQRNVPVQRWEHLWKVREHSGRPKRECSGYALRQRAKKERSGSELEEWALPVGSQPGSPSREEGKFGDTLTASPVPDPSSRMLDGSILPVKHDHPGQRHSPRHFLKRRGVWALTEGRNKNELTHQSVQLLGAIMKPQPTRPIRSIPSRGPA